MDYDVLRRPADGAGVAFAFCEDGMGHCFQLAKDQTALRTPACGKAVRVKRPTRDSDEICESCAVAAESWAQGGLLQVKS